MKYNLFLTNFIILTLYIGIKVNGSSCTHSAIVKPSQKSCHERDAYYINYYFNNGCSNIEACLIPINNNKIFPESYKAENSSECIVIKGETYCAADLVENISCENCTFPKFIDELKKIMGEDFQYEFSNNSTSTIPSSIITEKIQCANSQYLNDKYEKCRLSYGYYIQHEFYPDCDKTYYACFYEKVENTINVDPNVIISEDKSKCLVKKSEENNEFSYCAVGYSNIPCEGCTFSEYVKKAREIFGDYLEKEIGINEEDETARVMGSVSYGIKIYSFTNYFTVIFNLLIILVLIYSLD